MNNDDALLAALTAGGAVGSSGNAVSTAAEVARLNETVMMGHSTSIPLNTTQTVLYTPVSDESTDFEVHVQVTNMHSTKTGFSVSSGEVYGIVTYTLGEATYQKQFLIQSDAPYRFKVIGRRVQIDIAWVGVTNTTLTPLNVIAGGGRAGFGASPLDFYVPTWILRNIVSTEAGNVDIPNGLVPALSSPVYTILLAWQAMLLSMPSGAGSAACCLMFFDSVNQANLLTAATPLWVSPPFTAANQWYALDDGDCPQIRYVNGLVWALSSTFDTYTPVGSGATIRVDCKLGS